MAQLTPNRSGILLESGTNELEIICFVLRWKDPLKEQHENAIFGINAAKVKEMVAVPEEITPVPKAPPCVRGIFLIRNLTVPVIDLCAWFNFEPYITPEFRKKWVVIVSEINGKPFGFITHGVEKVSRISWEHIQAPPEVISRYKSLTAVCLIEGKVVQMVDFERIVATIDQSMSLPTVSNDAGGQQGEGEENKKEVLIVDDSTFIRSQLLERLKSAGYKVSCHQDGQAAWDYLEGLREKGVLAETVLAVITDIEMPRMDGHHLCKRIKERPEYRGIPVMLFSSMISDSQHHKGVAVGADDQITKPELVLLMERLNQCLNNIQVSAT